MRADQHVLHDVLRIVLGATQQAPGVTSERAAMARVEQRERSIVARTDTPGKLGVIDGETVKDGGHGVDER